MNKEGNLARVYAIHYLDNGGKPGEFSKRHKVLTAAIQEEEKRRLMVSIRYKMNEKKEFHKKIYKILKISGKTTLEPRDLYNYLGNMTNNQLFSILHDRKKKKK